MAQYSRLKIAVFIPSFRGGGAERAMLLFAKGAVARGYAVDILVSDSEGPFQSLVPREAKLLDFHASGVLGSLMPLTRYLRRERPLALYATMAHTNIIAILAAKLARVSSKVVIREANVPLSATRRSRSLGSRAVRFLQPIVYPWADAILAVSKDVAEELCAMSGSLQSRIAIVPTPVVSEDMLRQGEEEPPHPWFKDAIVPIILAAGRLNRQKNFSCLLRAFEILKRSHNARLVILGEGPERGALEALAQELGVTETLLMPGFADNPFMYMKRASVFALSSLFEGMPNVLLQAMAFGTPVVATDCPGGARDVLGGNDYGILVPTDDPEALAKALASVISSPHRTDAGEYVRRHFGVEQAVAGYLDVLHR